MAGPFAFLNMSFEEKISILIKYELKGFFPYDL